MRQRYFALGIGSIFALMLAGCGGGSSSSAGVTSSLVNPTGKVTTFASVAAMKPGAGFFLILDRPSGKVTVPIKLVGTSNDSSGRVIYFSIEKQPIGEGDSGSLIVDKKGNSVGALATGVDATGNTFSSTAIEDEESIFLSGPVASKPMVAASGSGTALRRVVQGVSPYLWGIMSKDKRNNIPNVFTLDTSRAPKTSTRTSMATGTPYSTTIFMLSSYGDSVTAFTTGAITTPYLGKMVCYGRPLSWEGGSQDIPCCYGKVIDMVNDAAYGYIKIGVPDPTKSAGTLVDDRRFGVIVDPTVQATPITIDGTVTLNTNAPVTFHGKVSKDLQYESNFALTNVTQGVENVLDASDAAGSATGSATVNFADGTSQTVDLTDSNSAALISDLYYAFQQVLYNTTTFAPIPLSSITFNITITTS